MKVVYGISRWTNASRSGARHIDDGLGKPLCGGNGRKTFTWEIEKGEPTCAKCAHIKRLYGIQTPDGLFRKAYHIGTYLEAREKAMRLYEDDYQLELDSRLPEECRITS